ncbi:MAG: hypothetical protein KDC95_20910 [Planctomycetes bacterium]|nr:hypothetical protein [Planctomycetota bacterium]
MTTPTLTSKFLWTALCVIGASQSSAAQWTKVELDSAGVAYMMPKKDLQVVPANKARPVPHRVDHWSSIKPFYSGDDRYEWSISVYAFYRKAAVTGDASAKKEKPQNGDEDGSDEEVSTEDMLRSFARGRYADFSEWLEKSERGAEVTVKGKKDKQSRGDRLEFEHWEWKSASGSWDNIGAVYRLPDREILMLGVIPAAGRKKLERTIMRSIESLTLHEPVNKPDERRKVDGEEFADVEGDAEFTKLRRRLLDEAATSVERLDEWDIFCTEQYIVLYSFDKGKQAKARSFAKDLAGQMDEMNREYRERFPPHDNMTKWWSVLRICRNKEEFDRYGGTSGGVIGWFNPASKELVIFNAKKLGLFKTDTVAFHEGWHQYAHFWFPGAHLHRWFDEGTGDFFGSMKRLGKNNWKPETSRMRKETIRELVRTDATVKLQEIVHWHMDKFYSAKATDYYAQGWAMVDFFTRGPKTPYWKDSWDKILPTYIEVSLKSKDTEKAVEEAFKGVDWAELEEAFKNYVLRSL